MGIDEVAPLPTPEKWKETYVKSEDIPPIRLHRFGSEDLHASRKLDKGIHSEAGGDNCGSSFPRTSSLTLGQSDETKSFWKGVETGEQGTHSYRVYLQTKDRITVSPWNEVPLWTHDSNLRVVVKTPRGRWAELDVAMEDQSAPLQLIMRKGQLSHYSVDAPWNVCLLPQTWTDPDLPNVNYGGLPYNGRPLEVLELSLKERRVGEVYVVKILGGFAVIDMETGQLSWKLLAVDIEDMSAAVLHDVSDLHQHYPGLLEEIREWLRICNCMGPEDAEAKFGLNERAAERQAMMIEITQANASWQSLAVSKRHVRGGKQHRRSSSSIRPIPSCNPESNETLPGVSAESEPDLAAEDSPGTKFSAAVPKLLRAKAKKSRPAYFDSLAAAGPPPCSPSQAPPPGKAQLEPPPHPERRHHRNPNCHGQGGGHGVSGTGGNPKVLTIRTSEGMKAQDSSWMGKIIIRQARPRVEGLVVGQDIVRRRTGVEQGLASPQGRGAGRGVKAGVTGGAQGLPRDSLSGLVYATAVQLNLAEVGENIPVATALEKDVGKPEGEGEAPPRKGVGRGMVLPEPILIPPSRSSSDGSTNKTPSMSPPFNSPSSGSRGGKLSSKDRRVSWGWVEEVEIPSREGEGSRKERGKKEAPKREGKVAVVSKSGS